MKIIKKYLLKMKFKSYRYLLFAIFITCNIMLLKKTDILDSIRNSIIIRLLTSEKVRTYSCDKSRAEFLDKYQGDFVEEPPEIKDQLNEAERSIVDFAKKRTYSNIKPYLKRVGLFIFFLVLVIIFILCWISYGVCCCCNCFLFYKSESRIVRFISFIVSVVLNLAVIVISIIVLSLLSPFFKRANGIVCGAMLFFDHINYGISPQYPNHTDEWNGLNGVIKTLNETEEKSKNLNFSDVDEAYNNVKNNYDEIIQNSSCLSDYKDYENQTNDFNNIVRGFFEDLTFDDEIKKFAKVRDIIDNTIDDIEDDLYDFLDKYMNGHIKRGCIAIFVITLILGIFAIICLVAYYFTKNNLIRIAYIVIWNISMLFMLLAIIISVVFGVVSYVLDDGIQVGYYILSSDNLLSDKPLVFSKKHEAVFIVIDNCANEDGEFFKLIGDLALIGENILGSIYDTMLETLKNKNCKSETDAQNALIRLYELFSVKNRLSFSILYPIVDIKCAFLKNDKNILLKEMHTTAKKGKTLCALQFTVGILLGISVLAGILFVHRYKYPNGKSENRTVNISNSSGNPNATFETMS